LLMAEQCPSRACFGSGMDIEKAALARPWCSAPNDGLGDAIGRESIDFTKVGAESCRL
jgi:hypothetical protein